MPSSRRLFRLYMEEILFALWVAAIIGPLAWSWYHKASIAMAMTLSLLFGYIVQLIWGWTLDSSQLTELYLRVVMIPALVESGHVHTLITSGFLHSWNSPLHVLGNIGAAKRIHIILIFSFYQKRESLVF